MASKAVRFHLDNEQKDGGAAPPGGSKPLLGAAGAAPNAPGGPGGPGGPAVYASAPDAAAEKPKQGCLDAMLGRPAPGASESSVVARQPRRKLKPGEEPTKRFYFRLDKIQAIFELALDKAFLEFEFGGLQKQETVDTGDTVPKKRTIKGPDGKDVEEEYQARVMSRKIQVLKPRADVYFTRIKSNLKPKVKVPFHDHNCEGYWEGPYSDLDKESITVKLWHYGGIGEPNHLIGVGKELLKDIVASKIDREMRVLKYIPGATSYRKETMARLTYKLEFQEDYKYNILFKDWELRRLHEPIYPDVPQRRWCGCLVSGERSLSFEIVQSRQGWGGWFVSGLKAYLFPCAEKRWDNRCALPVEKEGTSGKRDGVIRYPGTRAWLEDESLSITLSKKLCCCIPVVVGRKAEELQGVLDYGHIDTTIDVTENMNLLTCCPAIFNKPATSMFKIAGTVDSSGMTEGDNLPIFRQLGNADPSQDGLLQQEGATFLVVKVVGSKGLSIPSRDEFKESLNPSVTVYWNGMQKSTRIIKNGGSKPLWDDEVHFKIMDRHTAKKKAPKKFEDFNEVTRDSRVELLIWDNDGLAGRTALGKCYVDFRDIYFSRRHVPIITFASHGRRVERLVYSGNKPLEAPFATDGAERKKKNRTTDGEDNTDEFGARSVEFAIYFDRMDNNPIPLISKKQKELHALQRAELEKKHGGEPLSAASIKSGRAYWDQALHDVVGRDKRFFPFYGIDEYSGTYHFLPSFLKPMQPPAEVRAIGTLAFYVYAIECTRKPEPYIDPLKDGTSPPRGDVWTWADPFFFLEKRKGDVKDHAILLCNFLLGLGMDAYVCIGTARTKQRATAHLPHFWVMTREEADTAEGTKEYLVRFWETTNGRTYTVKGIVTEPPVDRRGKRYLEEPDVRPPPIDEETFKKQREKAAEAERQRELGIAQVIAENEADEEGLVSLAAAAAAAAAAEANLGAASSSEPKVGKIVIDGKMRAELKPMELQALELNNHQFEIDMSFEDDQDDVGDAELLAISKGRPIALAAPGATDAHIRVKEALDEKTDVESTRSIFDERRQAIVNIERDNLKQKRKIVSNLEDPTLKQQKKKLHQQCPYASVDTVFNHKHLYANLASSDPELVFFDFERHPDRWCEFQEAQYRQYLGIKHLKEFYPDKGLASVKAPQRDAEDLESSLTDLIMDTIRTHRKYPSGNLRPSMDTEFIQRFEFQIDDQQENKDHTALAHILKRLDMEHAISLQPAELVPLVRARGGFVDPLPYQYVDKEWRRQVLQDLPSGYTFREESLLLKHSDPNRIANETIRRCQEMIETSEFRKPRFAVGCRLYRMAASVCPVRVFVCVVAKDG